MKDVYTQEQLENGINILMNNHKLRVKLEKKLIEKYLLQIYIRYTELKTAVRHTFCENYEYDDGEKYFIKRANEDFMVNEMAEINKDYEIVIIDPKEYIIKTKEENDKGGIYYNTLKKVIRDLIKEISIIKPKK